MMILNNEEVSELLSMENCLRHLESAYKELSERFCSKSAAQRSLSAGHDHRWSLLFQDHGRGPHAKTKLSRCASTRMSSNGKKWAAIIVKISAGGAGQ